MSDVVLDVGMWRPFAETPHYDVLITRSATGKEQRRLLHSSQIRSFSVNFGYKTRTQMEVIKAFYNARYGEYDSFYFPNNNDRHLAEAIGTKTNGQTYTCSHYPMGNERVVDGSGVLLVADVNYSINKVTGVLTFIGDYAGLTIDFDPCVKVRFDGEVTFNEISHDIFAISANLVEVL